MKAVREAGTRGNGLLEGFLARQRSAVAERLIPQGARRGSILDIGCGAVPLFLINTRFDKRFGLDRLAQDRCIAAPDGGLVQIVTHDVEKPGKLPFDEGRFSVVTMLAVIEHIETAGASVLLREARRVLCSGGILVLTTPAAWTDTLLRGMAAVRLVSHEEIREHKAAYTRARLADVLEEAGFARDRVELGTFELGMNIWAKATKQP